MASQVSLPPTPQGNTTYETYMQSLQQKLSSISMQNATTLGPLSPQSTFNGLEISKSVLPNVDSTTHIVNKLHVDSSGPSSGTTTTEMLSPVRDQDITTTSSTDLSKPKNLTTLNNELSKINARKDSTVVNIHEEKITLNIIEKDVKTDKIKSPTNALGDTKVRRVSRFKVSVVTEPDQSKLVIPPEHNADGVIKVEEENNLQSDSNSIVTTPVKCKNSIKEDTVIENEAATLNTELKVAQDIITNTMQRLQDNLNDANFQQAKHLTDSGSESSVALPHAVVNPTPIIGITAPNTITRKSSVIVDKNKSALSLKKSLSYNDLANEIANLFSKPKKKSNLATKTSSTVNSVTNTNPRKMSGPRRMSKTFRRTPTIIIHPPEENLDRFTNSCPDIQALLLNETGNKPSSPNDYSELIRHEMNYSCPDINILPELSRNPSPNLKKYNPNFSRSCPNINALLDVKDKKPLQSGYIDLTNSCPNINDMKNSYVPTTFKKRNSSSESIDILDDSFDSLDTSFERYDDHSFHRKFNGLKSFDSFSNPFSQCLYELDMLKDEVNDIKNECECLLYECSCQQHKKNYNVSKDDFKITHYNTPAQKNPLKLLPTKHLEPKVDKTVPKRPSRLNRKISFTNLPYSSRANDLLHASYTRTASEPNLLKNTSYFHAYNRSCSDVGKIINDRHNHIPYNTHIIQSEEHLDSYNKQHKNTRLRHNDSADSLGTPSSLNINHIKSTDNLDTLGKSVQQNSAMYKQKIIKKSPKKHDISPTDILRNKMKQSLSMFDLNASKSEDNYDSYHTIHGGMKLSKDLTDFSLKNYKNQSENLHSSWAGQKNIFQNNENLLAIAKCCCGDPNCQKGRLQVVPITFQQLLDSNLSNDMNETLEEMLSRQQAELNALIDAHKRQQIDYMKSITDISKPSGSKKEC